ncbi:MAG: hypothetical protein ACRDDF_09835, partial [Aeromonas sp.]
SNINKGEFTHHIVNSNRLLSPNQVYSQALGYIPETDIVIKRIRKPLGNYLRRSINKSATEKIYSDVLGHIGKKLNAKFKKQSLNRNPKHEEMAALDASL